MDAVEAAVQITVAAIGAVGGAVATIKAAQIQARKARSKTGEGDNNMKPGRRPLWASTAFVFVIAPAAGALIALALLSAGRAIAEPSPSTTLHAPTLIEGYYYPSGWMGDGEKGTKHVQLNDQWKENPHSAPTCIRISYQPGGKGWAGVYWQYPDGNWGDQPGRKIEAATKLSFWARGAKGGELVEFKAGGINAEGKKHADSFEKTLGTVELKTDWQRFELALGGADTSSVLAAFAWVATRNGNPDGLTFFVDDIRYEGAGGD